MDEKIITERYLDTQTGSVIALMLHYGGCFYIPLLFDRYCVTFVYLFNAETQSITADKKMSFSFTATIHKTGINPCVPVPKRITDKMVPAKGYIPIKGKINGHPFVQTLVPVKGKEYRLYVNGPMLKGGKATNGDTAKFVIEQNLRPETRDPKMLPAFKKRLTEEKLATVFAKLTPYRQKEILKYLSFLKTEESVQRNIAKVIAQLKQQEGK